MTTKKTINANAISKLILSVSALVLCASLFVFSINKAMANDTKEFNFPETITSEDLATVNGSNGKYRIDTTSVMDEHGYAYIYLTIYDTTNANASFYYGSAKTKKFVKGFPVPNPF